MKILCRLNLGCLSLFPMYYFDLLFSHADCFSAVRLLLLRCYSWLRILGLPFIGTGVDSGFQPWGGGRDFFSNNSFSGIRNKSKEKGSNSREKEQNSRKKEQNSRRKEQNS